MKPWKLLWIANIHALYTSIADLQEWRASRSDHFDLSTFTIDISVVLRTDPYMAVRTTLLSESNMLSDT